MFIASRAVVLDARLRSRQFVRASFWNSTSSCWRSSSNFAFSRMYRKNDKETVLVTRTDVPEVALKVLRDHYQVDLWESLTPIPKKDLLARIQGCSGLFCLLTDIIDEEVLQAAGSNLKVIGTMSVGHNHLDLEAIKKRNILVGYTPDILTNATAELAIALLLATSRRLVEANKAVHKGQWNAWSPSWMTGQSLTGSNVGIVGLGRIGTRVAQLLHCFGVHQILYTSRTEKQEASRLGAKLADLDTLVKESDIIIVTTALVPETREMFNKASFQKMKKSAIFINVSRGEIVDQPALIEALKNGTIWAAGLDVMTPEPLPPQHELLKLDNCVIIPHLGSATIKTREDMAVMTAENILAVLQNRPKEMPSPLQF